MNSGRPPGTLQVSELRERLRALGYLDAGLDRFVLAPAREERRVVSLAWRVSLRVGLLAALLLGPAAAVGIASRLPALISGVRDAGVIAAYLAVLFGAAATATTFVAALAVRAAARRTAPATGRRLAVGAGVVIVTGCLAYLTLWWGATAGAVWTSPLRTIVALGVAVMISLVLGHAVSLSALVLLAREDDHGPGPRAPTASWRLLLAIGVLAFAGAAALLAVSAGASDASSGRAPAFAVVPTGVRVIVVGIDGFDPALLAEIDAARAPLLHRLAGRAVLVEGRSDADPARVWTTVATGANAEDHGVTGLALRRVAGVQGSLEGADRSPLVRAVGAVTDLVRLTRPTPVSGMTRRQKTMWEVAAEKGLNAAVVNWWATWPATGTPAIVLSDRAVLRLERGGPQSAEIAPPGLYEPLRAKWPEIVAHARARVATIRADAHDDAVGGVLGRSALLDAEQVRLARDPLLGAPDLLAVYLPGLDIAQHALLQDPAGTGSAASAVSARIEALRRYYLFLDTILADLLAELPDDTTVLLVTHPGRVTGRAQASVGLSGAHVRTDRIGTSASLTDVAPTVLYLLGVPVSRELAGRPLVEVLDAGFVGRHPVREVETYGGYVADAPVAEGVPLDDEMMDRLRSLGYIR